ncbi:nuclear pore complex subunit [Spiromyces aspiralis]|uniref:Nuclear pore complex subunit n=1 Tax=Spiromyces aspiralis TaxID=68401 RepID=A0ACC1HAT0_9FUNG|nr:nuclear pore complex subunit [Spiromyces aspiralis]
MLVKSCPEGLDGPQTASLLIGGSRRFLEESFVDYIEKVIAQRPLEAALGGSPSIHNKIRSFLKLKFSSSKNNPDYLEVYNDDAIWAHMYYLLRTGNLKEMLKYARAIEDAVADSDPYFIVYLKKYVDSSDHTLLPSDRERLQSSFNAMKSSPSSIDPYKFAIYKILGRCDLTKKTVPHTVRTTEDYIWLQLMLVRADESADVPAASRYTLRDLQRLLLKFGPKHFDPHGNNPLLYFRVLLLSLQFEQAINHLVQSEVYQVDAMHFAVALAYYNYLRRISPEQTTHYADYVSVVDDVSYLDYAKLVIHYIRALPADAIEYAVHYLITINTGGTTAAQHQAQLCQSAIIRVLYESREYAYFLGDILKDGSRKRGFLEQYYGLLGFKSKDEFVFGTTKQLADKSHKDGRLPDSVLLYNLAGQYNSVLKVMIKQLGEVLYMHNNRGAMAGSLEGRGDRGGTLDTAVGNPEDVVHIAHAVLKHYESQDHIYSQIDKGNVTTCHLLLSLINFVQAYSDGKLELALSIIQNTGLVPFDCDIAEATRKSEQIRDMDPTITRNFADILLATMDIMSKLYAGLKESPYLDATRQANMDKLRRSVRSLMVFAGMIQFRMPPDTFARLNRIDAFMN